VLVINIQTKETNQPGQKEGGQNLMQNMMKIFQCELGSWMTCWLIWTKMGSSCL
jgi:hypothetical protein